MLPLFHKSTSWELWIDAGSSAIKFCVTKRTKEGVNIVHFGIEEIDQFSLESRLDALIANTKETFHQIDKLNISFSPTIFRAKLFEIPFSRNESKKRIDGKEEEQLGGKIIQRSQKEILSYFAKELAITEEDLVVSKIKITQVEIDGYPVPQLKGFHGASVLVRVLGTCLPLQYWQVLSRLKKKHKLHSFELIHWAEGIEAYGIYEQKDGIYVDVGDKITQIGVIKDTRIVGITQFEAAGDNFTYGLEDTIGLTENEAKEYKNRYVAGDFSPELRKRIHETFSLQANRWFDTWKKRVLEIGRVLPANIFLMGGGANAQEIVEQFNEETLRDFPFNGAASLLQITPQAILPSFPFAQSNNIAYSSLFFTVYAKQKEIS